MAKRGTPPIRQLSKRIEGFLDDPAAELDAQLVAAREWIGLSGGEPRRFGEVSQRLPFHAEDWLFELPGFLVLAGRPADAQDIAHEIAAVFSGDVILADLAVRLAENGHAAAARDEIEESVRKYPDDAWVGLKCGDALRSLGDVEAAEREYRRGLALAVAEDDSLTAEDAVERLAPYLEELGREAEARALRAWFEERFDDELEDGPFGGAGADGGLDFDDDEFEPAVLEPVRRAGPKVGRNDPCPCGSGRKYKKCCAASDAAQAQDSNGTAVTRLVTSDGNTLTIARASWRVDDPVAVRAALAAAPDFDGDADGAFVWLPGEPGSAVGGRLELKGDVLTADCLSRERLERLAALVAARFPGARRDGFATFTNPWHEVAARAARTSRAENAPAAASPELERVQRAALERHYRAWTDEPVPALDGKTPRAAAKDRALRPRLVDLIHQIENVSVLGSTPRQAFDCGWLRKELGIGRDE